MSGSNYVLPCINWCKGDQNQFHGALFFQKDRVNSLPNFIGSCSSSWRFCYKILMYLSTPKELPKHMCYRLCFIAPLLWLNHAMFYFINYELFYECFTWVQNTPNSKKGNGLFVLSAAGWIICTSLFFHQVLSCFCVLILLLVSFDGQPVNCS